MKRLIPSQQLTQLIHLLRALSCPFVKYAKETLSSLPIEEKSDSKTEILLHML
jgi:hypothetical protein